MRKHVFLRLILALALLSARLCRQALPPPEQTGPQLPRGALIALRQSGGLRFSTREVMVYHDGRVIARRQGKLDTREGSRLITPGEVADLKAALAHSSLRALPRFASIGRPSPDGYAYELIARTGRKSKSIEFFDGSIPCAVQPLLAQLKTLMAADDAQE
jgi:hypothetical protein